MNKSRFLLAFGSETGQSKSIAQGLVDVAREQHQIVADIFELDDVDGQFKLQDEPLVVIITSSTGDGEPPSNASKFWRKIRREKNTNFLSHMKYTVLGLGDTNYSNFCNCPRVIDRHFEELGATRFYPSAWADDAVGLDRTVEPWIEGLWPALKQVFGKETVVNDVLSNEIENLSLAESSSEKNQRKNKFESDIESLTFSPEVSKIEALNLPSRPVPSLVVRLVEPTEDDFQHRPTDHRTVLTKRTCLTSPPALKSIYSVDLKFSEEFVFEVGDAIRVHCPNDSAEVELLFDRLDWKKFSRNRLEIEISPENTKKSAKVPAHIPRGCSLHFAFVNSIDIRSAPRKNLLRLFVDATSDPDEKRRIEELCSREGSENYVRFVLEENLSLLDFLNHFPSCRPDFGILIEFLPALMPRFYSICSSPLDDSRSLSFVFSLMKFEKNLARTYERFGLCTNWLRTIDLGSEVFIQTRISQHFRLPSTLDTPLIMIGPGTGVAPFIGFLDHLYLSSKSINNFDTNQLNTWLFYGCRHRQQDFLFKEQIQMYEEMKILKKFCLSVSREENYPFRYVQDQLRANGRDIADLIHHHNAIIYVCGDIKVMVRDVRQTIVEILAEHSGIENPEDYVKSLEISRRYLLDIWS